MADSPQNTPVALVTGANKGIGREIARQLVQRGWHVVLTARDPHRGRTAAGELAAGGPGKVSFLVLDTADKSSIRAAANEFARLSPRLDALVNNAAILEDKGDILSVSADLFEKTLRTNTLGPLLVAQAFWPFLKAAHGRIVNISSVAGSLTEMGGEYPSYGISKAALNVVTKKLAHTGAADDIVANSVCPGWVRTDMGGAGAERSVAQGADTAVWLATEAPRTTTGKFLRDRAEAAW